jgi:hypothetical protein
MLDVPTRRKCRALGTESNQPTFVKKAVLRQREAAAPGQRVKGTCERDWAMVGILLWLMGVPLVVIILLYLIF